MITYCRLTKLLFVFLMAQLSEDCCFSICKDNIFDKVIGYE